MKNWLSNIIKRIKEYYMGTKEENDFIRSLAEVEEMDYCIKKGIPIPESNLFWKRLQESRAKGEELVRELDGRSHYD